MKTRRHEAPGARDPARTRKGGDHGRHAMDVGLWSGGAARGAGAGERRAHDRRQRSEGELGRCRQARALGAGRGYGLDRRHRIRPAEPEDRRQPGADELDLRPADQPRHHPRRDAGARDQRHELGAGGRRLEARARQQGARDRSRGGSAGADRHGRGRAAALGHGDQPGRRPRPDRQSRRQLDQRALDRRQAGRAPRRRRHGRAGRGGRDHTRRHARARRQVPGAQGRPALDRGPER